MEKLKKQKVYLSMPISGYQIEERIKTAEKIKKLMEEKDNIDIITPFDASPYDPAKPYGDCMHNCIKELIDCDAVVFLPDWYQSNGCRIEAEVARGCGLQMHFLTAADVLAMLEGR